ncbi:FRG domain-containing protein [Gallibacterium anatis]|uniref:FRG domain-containing protein n=1 Tax=Gallibacterium anatis TaxID=750 RepID=UPI0030057454
MNNENFFDEITIDTLDEFNKYIKDNILSSLDISDTDIPSEINIIDINYKVPNRYFRGHSKDDYLLQSTLEREISKLITNPTKEVYNDIQNDYLSKCKELLRGKLPEQSLLLTDQFDDEIWAIGQHFGLKTPLLDWTYSFNIALFFAFKDYNENTSKNNEYRVVYCLNNSLATNIKIIEPKIDIGGRLNAQQGVFTKYLYSELQEILESTNHSPLTKIGYYPLTKLKIKSSLRNKVISYLNKININNSTLFPDITGAIMDCHLHLDNILELKGLEYTNAQYIY